MFVAIVGPAGHEENLTLAAQGVNLGSLLNNYTQSVEACFVNNNPTIRWQTYIPQKRDRIKIHIRTGLPAIAGAIAAVASAAGASAATAAAVGAAVAQGLVGAVVSIGLSLIVRALTPGPKTAKLDGNSGTA